MTYLYDCQKETQKIKTLLKIPESHFTFHKVIIVQQDLGSASKKASKTQVKYHISLAILF
jgi:hypothetical protein